MSPGKLDVSIVHRHLLALEAAVQILRSHQGRSVEQLPPIARRVELKLVSPDAGP